MIRESKYHISSLSDALRERPRIASGAWDVAIDSGRALDVEFGFLIRS
jgi:hypothetical protein